GKIVFDLEMPQRPYTDVKLQIDPAVENFLATATVIGTSVLARGGSSEKSLDLGTFTLFDLTVQHLSRDTTLPLAESTFRYLHVEMSFANAPGAKNETKEGAAARFTPGVVQGAQVPPSREAQIIYTTVAQTTSIATVGRQTRATFEVPMRVPIEQVSFVLPPDFKGNFSRDVRVTALAEASDKDSGDARASLPETMAGTISRVHTTEAGRGIRTDELGIPAILGANLQRPAKVEVAIENGDDRPLPIAAVRLEMRQRKICFDAAAAGVGELGLFYGNPALTAPVYDYERLFAPSEKPLMADLGPETLNASYRAPAEVVRPFAERHPGVLWLALLAVIAALGLVAVRSSRTVVR
ncbi:MAG TPA: hypothetical protein VGU23_05690, partial [Acidobacteriaceae bacterium]|nr:hypothetical protein [Acidobacteriaceae bacterium]